MSNNIRKDKDLHIRVNEAFGKAALDLSLALGDRTRTYWPMTATIEYAIALAHAIEVSGTLEKILSLPGVRPRFDANLAVLRDGVMEGGSK